MVTTDPIAVVIVQEITARHLQQVRIITDVIFLTRDVPSRTTMPGFLTIINTILRRDVAFLILQRGTIPVVLRRLQRNTLLGAVPVISWEEEEEEEVGDETPGVHHRDPLVDVVAGEVA